MALHKQGKGRRSYAEKISMGHSIDSESEGGGTLGGFLKLVSKKPPNKETLVFITNWHVLRPSDKDLPAGKSFTCRENASSNISSQNAMTIHKEMGNNVSVSNHPTGSASNTKAPLSAEFFHGRSDAELENDPAWHTCLAWIAEENATDGARAVSDE